MEEAPRAASSFRETPVPVPAQVSTPVPLRCTIVRHNWKFSKVTTSGNTFKNAEWRVKGKGKECAALRQSARWGF